MMAGIGIIAASVYRIRVATVPVSLHHWLSLIVLFLLTDLAFYIEQKFGVPAIYCPPDMDPELGARYPLQSLKLHAELAGIGARSLAGDILLHPDYGYMYYASCFTELALPPDKPLADNPCPAPSCVRWYEV